MSAAALACRLDLVEGSPVTVVFENALICSTTEWAWVRQELRGRLSTLAYDRAGTGDSVRPAVRLGASAQVARLRGLLWRHAVTPPYVLVGHSVGGLLVRSFARRYPAEVCGLVLVDSSDPAQVPDVQDYDGLRRHVMLGHRLLAGGARAAAGRYDPGDDILPGLPPDERARAAQQLRRPGMHLAAAAELRAYRRSWCADAALWTTAPHHGPAVFLSAEDTVTTNQRHVARQRRLIEAVPGARHEVVAGAGHESIVAERRYATQVARTVLEVAGAPAPAPASAPLGRSVA